jgi:hypothetical protein
MMGGEGVGSVGVEREDGTGVARGDGTGERERGTPLVEGWQSRLMLVMVGRRGGS